MFIQAAQKKIQLQTVVQIKMYIYSLKWFNIRDERLLFLVLQAFRVLILHELDYLKNLLQKCTVIPYCFAALVIFEVVLNSEMYMHYLCKNLGKLSNLNPIFMP